MKPRIVDPKVDPQVIEAKNAARRKLLQSENRREYERDVDGLKVKVQETEGQDMREAIQDKINAWFVENRNPETGDYPDFPDTEEGGCGHRTLYQMQDMNLDLWRAYNCLLDGYQGVYRLSKASWWPFQTRSEVPQPFRRL
jgi:hypothetical protein